MLQSDFRVRNQQDSTVDLSSNMKGGVLPSTRGTPPGSGGGGGGDRGGGGGPGMIGPTSIYSRDPSRYMNMGAYRVHEQQQLHQQHHHHQQQQVHVSSIPPPPPPGGGSMMSGGSPSAASTFRSAEERGAAGPQRQRMSLLNPPPQSVSDYGLPPHILRPDRPIPPSARPRTPTYGAQVEKQYFGGNESSQPSCKKLRLGNSRPDIRSPLLIDTDRTRTGPAYNPQVEAISPTLPSESLRDESPLRSTKEELLQQIARVDREIAKTESSIAKLKKKKVELEEAATQPQREPEDTSSAPTDSAIRSLPQSLYAENRKKAQSAHQVFERLGPKNDLPLYNQPSDTPIYHENKVKYANFKKRLLEYFKARLKERDHRETFLTTTYSKLSSDWGNRIDKWENNSKRRGRECRTRETFEKVFPELRKQREDKERFSRVGSRIKSDADLEEIMDGLHEQELEDKKMKSYAVIPPILLDPRSRKNRFFNRNGLIEDPMQEYKDKALLNLWADQEKDIFKEKYLQHPKNFGIIKSYMERKNVSDCVQYYYMSKKTQNYRQLLRKNRARTRSTRNNQQSNPPPGSTAGVGSGGLLSGLPPHLSSASGLKSNEQQQPNGVTTRGQKEQKLDQSNSNNPLGSGLPSGLPEDEDGGGGQEGGEGRPGGEGGGERGPGGPLEFRGGEGEMEMEVDVVEDEGELRVDEGSGRPPPSSLLPHGVQSSQSPELPSNQLPQQPLQLSPRRKRGGGGDESGSKEGGGGPHHPTGSSSSDQEEEIIDLNGDRGGPHSCVVCHVELESNLQSRPLIRSQAVHYGLPESEIHAGKRVCTSCRCKAVRRRYKPTACPIPTCPARRARVKRLRPFPHKWFELSEGTRTAISLKYQIPPNVTKCCSACFNRISRRLSPNASLDTPDDPGSDTSRWTENEIQLMKEGLLGFGPDWARLASHIGRTKSELQCRNFYFNFRKKHGLEALVVEFKKGRGGDDGPPILTDEEESGSTTSSCDEGVNSTQQQDPVSAIGLVKKDEDYDSSATVSAEEEGSLMETERGGGKGQGSDGTGPRPKIGLEVGPIHSSHHPQLPLSGLTMVGPEGRGHHHHALGGPHSGSSSPLGLTARSTPMTLSNSVHYYPGPGVLGPYQSQQQQMSHDPGHHHPHSNLLAHHRGGSGGGNGPKLGVALPSPHRSHPSIMMMSGDRSGGGHGGPQQQPSDSHALSHSIPHHLNVGLSSHHHHPGAQRGGGGDGGPPPRGGGLPPSLHDDGHESMTVKDLMLATIERQLRRNPVPSNPSGGGGGGGSGMGSGGAETGGPGPSVSPTITSILKSQDRNHLPPPGQSQHLLLSQQQQQQMMGSGLSGLSMHKQQQQGFEGGPPPSQYYYAGGGKLDGRMMVPSMTSHMSGREREVSIQQQIQQQQQQHQAQVQAQQQQHHPHAPPPPHHSHLLQQQQPMTQMIHPLPPPQPIRDEYETLDLSMKKRSPSPKVTPPIHHPNGPPPAHQSSHDFGGSGGRGGESYYNKYGGPPGGSSMGTMGGRPRLSVVAPILGPGKGSPKVLPPPPLLAKPPPGSPSSMKDGSITHGTPIHINMGHGVPSKYEGLLRPMKEGSITQGTPLDKVRGGGGGGKEPLHPPPPNSAYAYERAHEYYKRASPSGYHPGGGGPQVPQGQGLQSVQAQGPGGYGSRGSPNSGTPHPGGGFPTQPDPHTSSRQIIINDYYTSQQMQQPPPPHPHHPSVYARMEHGGGGGKRGPIPVSMGGGGPPSVYLFPQQQRLEGPPYRQSPPPQSQTQLPPHLQQQRQGVIHRATNLHRGVVKVDTSRFGQGHDAFAHLVDIAAAQPSLPVPKPQDPPPQPPPESPSKSQGRVNLPRVDMVREGLGKSMVELERGGRGGTPQGPPPSHHTPIIPHPHQSPQQQQQQQSLAAQQAYRGAQAHLGPPHMIHQQQHGPPPSQQQQSLPDHHQLVRPRKDLPEPLPPPIRYLRDGQDATLTAASLIDAIITHQINQPSPHDSHAPANTCGRTGDRLFASFQRSVQPPGSQGRANQQQQQHSPPVAMVSHSQGRGQGHGPEEQQMMMRERERERERGGGQGQEPLPGTWGEHIDSIISKSYGIGRSGGGPPPSQQQQQRPPSTGHNHHHHSFEGGRGVSESVPTSGGGGGPLTPSSAGASGGGGGPPPPGGKRQQEDMGPYISWKLRRALQHEKNQGGGGGGGGDGGQLGDERHIIRVVQSERAMEGSGGRSSGGGDPQPPPRPSSASQGPPQDLSERSGGSAGRGQGGGGGPPVSSSSSSSELFGGRRPSSRGEGISPLDYVNNRIKEVMGTENCKEDRKGEESSSEGSSGVMLGGRSGGGSEPTPITSSSSNLRVMGSSSESSSGGGHQKRSGEPTSPEESQSGRATGGVESSYNDDKSKESEERSKSPPEPPDSPASMVIDESVPPSSESNNEKSQGGDSQPPSSMNPSYEPLTDEES